VRLACLEDRHIESTGPPGALAESAQKIKLRRHHKPLLLAPADAGRRATETRRCPCPHFDEDPFGSLARDQIDAAASKPHIALDRLQTPFAEISLDKRLGVKARPLTRGNPYGLTQRGRDATGVPPRYSASTGSRSTRGLTVGS